MIAWVTPKEMKEYVGKRVKLTIMSVNRQKTLVLEGVIRYVSNWYAELLDESGFSRDVQISHVIKVELVHQERLE